jgi:hypothetical protein
MSAFQGVGGWYLSEQLWIEATYEEHADEIIIVATPNWRYDLGELLVAPWLLNSFKRGKNNTRSERSLLTTG